MNKELIISKYVIYSKTDLKGIITEVSDAFCKISKYSRVELLGQPHNIVRHQDNLNGIFYDLWETIQSGNTWEGEIKNKAKDDTYYWARAYIEPEYNLNKEIIGYLAIRQDITKEKEFQKQHLILLESEKMASMGEMIGNIAHQWRQPLSSITTGVTGMMLQKEYGLLTDEIFYKTCNSINNQAQHLSQTIDDFRNYIKGDRKKKKFTLKSDINSFLHLIEGSLNQEEINIVMEIDDKIIINGYPNELIQCFINIFNNSKDAFEEQHIKEKYLFITSNQTNDEIRIIIKDNAGGIQEDVIGKIFEPYFTTKYQSQGTGLGLHMTYNLIVNGMNGSIIATNKKYTYKNKTYNGAAFILTLPN